MRPQQMYAGASPPPMMRRYELTHWFVTAVISGAWCSSPAMKCLATGDRRASSLGSKKAFSSPSNRETWVCMPEPGHWEKGLGMNVALMPLSEATSRMTTRKVMMLSAIVSASA